VHRAAPISSFLSSSSIGNVPLLCCQETSVDRLGKSCYGPDWSRKNRKMNHLLLLTVLPACITLSAAFTIHQPRHALTLPALRMSSYTADSSDYSAKDSDYDNDDDEYDTGFGPGKLNDEEEFDSKELKPVPMSRNSGNRFVAILWDRLLDKEGREAEDLHYDRIKQTEPHVMACRKANLYNDTFNTESMVDVVWSRQM
jgi:hypothetical protein